MIVRQTIFWMLYTTSGARCVKRASVRLICIFSLFLARCRAQPQSFRRIIFFRESWDFSGVEWGGTAVFGSDPPRRASLILPKNKGSEARLAINRRNPTPIPPHTHFFYTKKPINGRQAGRGRR